MIKIPTNRSSEAPNNRLQTTKVRFSLPNLRYFYFFKKETILTAFSQISKNSKKSSRNQNISSKKYSKIRCNDCKELINEEDLQRHKENCVKNQKKCPHCKEFFPTRLIVIFLKFTIFSKISLEFPYQCVQHKQLCAEQ